MLAGARAALDQLVSKPVDGSGGYGIVIGPAAREPSSRACARMCRRSAGWIAQGPVALSTTPTFVDGMLEPRHVDLRPFAVNDGEDVWVVPGGLHTGRAPGGQPDRELEPGRRLQGHLGAREIDSAPINRAMPSTDRPPRLAADAASHSCAAARSPGPHTVPLDQQQQQQQQSGEVSASC